MLDLNETQFGLLAATPVFTGSLIWMYWTEVREAEVIGRRATTFSLKG